jgi:hypothetical protein
MSAIITPCSTWRARRARPGGDVFDHAQAARQVAFFVMNRVKKDAYRRLFVPCDRMVDAFVVSRAPRQ